MISEELYTGHFGLSERPFTLVPDPGFLFWSKQHRRAFAVLVGLVDAGVDAAAHVLDEGAEEAARNRCEREGRVEDERRCGHRSPSRGQLQRWIDATTL